MKLEIGWEEGGSMSRIKWPQMTLLGRIVLFLSAFGAAMALEIGIGYYQTSYVLEPLGKTEREYPDDQPILE